MKNLKFGIIKSKCETEDNHSNKYCHFEGEMVVNIGNFLGFADSFFAEMNREHNVPLPLNESELESYKNAHSTFFDGFKDTYFNIGYIPFLPENMIWVENNENIPALWVENKDVLNLINTSPENRIHANNKTL